VILCISLMRVYLNMNLCILNFVLIFIEVKKVHNIDKSNTIKLISINHYEITHADLFGASVSLLLDPLVVALDEVVVPLIS